MKSLGLIKRFNTKMNYKNNYIKILYNPKSTFNELKGGTRNIIKRMFVISLLVQLIWLIRTLIGLKVTKSFTSYPYELVFGSLNFRFFYSFIVILFVLSIIIIIVLILISLILKLLFKIASIKIYFKDILNIVIISSSIFVYLHLIESVISFYHTNLLFYIQFGFFIYYLVLIKIGIGLKLENKSKNKSLNIIFCLLILITLILPINQLYSKLTNEDIKVSITAKIGDKTYFTEKDILSMCKSRDCVALYPETHCYQNDEGLWSCDYGFTVKVSESAALRFANITNKLSESKQEPEILNESLMYYIDGESTSEIQMPVEIKGTNFNKIQISGSSQGNSLNRAKYNSFSELVRIESSINR